MALNITLEVVCPSGLKGRLRGMKVKDEQIFLDPKYRKSGSALTQVLQTCWESTLEPGPYKNEINWNYVALADRYFSLIQLRIASYGEDFDFEVTCDACAHNFGWGVNLNELDIIPMSSEGKAYLATGIPIAVKLSCGDIVKMRIPNGTDESYIANLGPKDRARHLTLHLARRIVEINGKTIWSDVVEEVEELPAKYAGELWNAIDDHEGGVDTSFMIECPKCDREQRVSLPFTPAFFSNRKEVTGWSKRSVDSTTTKNG